MTSYRPVPGKFAFDTTINAPAKVVAYGTDASGEYVAVKRAGSYGATVHVPVSCIRRPTDEERVEIGAACDAGFWR